MYKVGDVVSVSFIGTIEGCTLERNQMAGKEIVQYTIRGNEPKTDFPRTYLVTHGDSILVPAPTPQPELF